MDFMFGRKAASRKDWLVISPSSTKCNFIDSGAADACSFERCIVHKNLEDNRFDIHQ